MSSGLNDRLAEVELLQVLAGDTSDAAFKWVFGHSAVDWLPLISKGCQDLDLVRSLAWRDGTIQSLDHRPDVVELPVSVSVHGLRGQILLVVC